MRPKLLCGELSSASTIGRVGSKPEFGWRPLTASQTSAWASLLAAIEAVDHQDETVGEEDLREDFNNPEQDFVRGSVAVYDGPAMIAYCVLEPHCSGEPRHEVRHSGGVHPAYRGRGLGTALLEWAERMALPLHDDRHEGRPLLLSGRHPSRLEEAAKLFSASGCQPSRWFLRMTTGLFGGGQPATAPAGIKIVPVTAERSADALLVRNEAFRDHWGSADLTPQEWAHFSNYPAYRPELSFLAYEGAEPLGVVISHEYEQYNRLAGRRDLYIALVGTRRAARRRGIGSALVTRALVTARADGFASATLDADADSPTGAVGIYERLGFTIQDTWATQTKQVAA
jgi:mycothiol synthase